MHGNVWEWVRDCYDANAYRDRGPYLTASPQEDSIGCGRRVLRGGSFDHGPRDLRSAVRYWLEPGLRYDNIGFRCVRGSVRQLVD
jgi:formylglycine-generating enzyme required for sulfatase activity